MAKHLRRGDLERIVDKIRSWSDRKLKWNDVVAIAATVTGTKPTRQTLNSHASIKAAFLTKRKDIREHGNERRLPSSLKIAAERIARLSAAVNEMNAREAGYKEQFVRWQYNAWKYAGLTETQLNEELPRIDRNRTDGLTSIDLNKAPRPQRQQQKCNPVCHFPDKIRS